MDINYIKKLASSNEGVDIEFKQTTGQLNRGMETLFTNDSPIIETSTFADYERRMEHKEV